MIRIVISREAYVVLNDGQEPPEAALAPQGVGYALWLKKGVLDRLTASRGHGESYSDVILRLAAEEAA